MFTIERAVTVSNLAGDSQAVLSFTCFHNGSEWECRCRIPGADHPAELRALGEDALQALHLAIRNSELMIELAESRGILVWWTERGDRCRLRDISTDSPPAHPTISD